MIGVRTFPSFMIAVAALFASMVSGAAAILIEKHNTVVYLPLAQGAIYAVFTFLLLREKHGLLGAFIIAICCTVLFTPHYAWYFLWLVPFLCFFPWPSVFWLTLSAPLLYRTAWPPTIAGFSLEYAPFAVLLVVENLKFFNQKEAARGRVVASRQAHGG